MVTGSTLDLPCCQCNSNQSTARICNGHRCASMPSLCKWKI